VTTVDDVRAYWERHIHDLEITRHPVGSRGFFDDLDQYHFEKLHHLLRLVDFDGYAGRRVLEVGCGAGVDLARFARGGALVTGVDLAESAIALARANFEQQGLKGEFRVADGERLPFADNEFDLVYAHGVVQYTANPAKLVAECRRVLKPGGQAVFQVYNRISWLNALSRVMKVGLEHQDAPVLLKFSIGEFKRLLDGFREVGSCRSGSRSSRASTAAGRARSTTAYSSAPSTSFRSASCVRSGGIYWPSVKNKWL
jgi:SAM-dependent methyltransferase